MKSRIFLHRLLVLLVLVLTFEGIARKWVPSGVAKTGILFLKDGICLVMLMILAGTPSNPLRQILASRVQLFAAMLFPLAFLTGLDDPWLAVFGAKQYVLWAVVGLAMITAYTPDWQSGFFRLLTMMALMVIPTTLIAVYEQGQPASHWMNRSTDGGTLQAFSAAGYLRVSSTFSFVAQYCMFLNALCFAIPAALARPAGTSWWRRLASAWILIPMLLVGTYITGSRGAVVGNIAIACIGGSLLLLRGGKRGAGMAVGLAALTLMSMVVLRAQFPEFFAAYDARTDTKGEFSHTDEIVHRVTTGVFGWTGGLPPRAPATMFGYGLGVMSNGSAQFSNYAASWRSDGFWTETDQATTLFEGGYYLILLWYGLRFWVIARTIASAVTIRRFRYFLPACFAAGFVAVNGVMGNLAMHPPVAIWWWMAVGSVACLNSFDRRSVELPTFVLVPMIARSQLTPRAVAADH